MPTRKVTRGRAKRGKPRRRRRYRRARKAVDRRQNRNISKLYKLVKYGKERKFIDQTATSVGVDQNWLNLLPRDLTFIVQGDTGSSRVANKCKIHSHHLKIKVTYGDVTNLFRIMVIRFPNQSASLVDIADVLETPTATSPLNLMSMLKRNGDTKFQVLWDTGVVRINDALKKQVTYDVTIKPRGSGFYTGYNSPSANACISGFTYLVACTDSLIAPNPTFTTSARTTFSG